MIYDVESFNFYKQEELLNQSINSDYAGLSLKFHVKLAVPIDEMDHPLVKGQAFK